MPPDNITIFIINPIAGTKRKQAILKAISDTFAKDDFEIFFSEFQGHAHEIAITKAFEGYQQIVAVGGDGTVNEVASALVGTSSHLGIIPAGSGNGLARHLHIPMTLIDAVKVIKTHKLQKIDAGKANGKYFFCTCGTGFDAAVGKKFANDGKRGMINYVKASVDKYITYSPKTYILKTEGKEARFKAFLVTFANSGQFGNNAYIAPNAIIDDGLIDLCILRPFPKSSTIDLGLRLFFKNIDQSPYLEVMRVSKASLKRKRGQKMIIHLDGEPMTIRKKLKIKVVPGALQVMVPEKNNNKLSNLNLEGFKKLSPKLYIKNSLKKPDKQ
jgi:diacylglycerol kinase (ATP)